MESLTRRSYLTGTLGAGAVAIVGTAPAAAQAQTFELRMTDDGWVGIAPDSIAGTTNPTLEVEAGESYAIRWTNETTERHNLVIMDEDRSMIVRSDYLTGEGETQTVEFTADTDITSYLCEDHLGESGEFEVAGGPTPTSSPTPSPTSSPTPSPTDTPTATESGGDGNGGDGDGGGETTGANGAGFGIIAAVSAVVAAGAVAFRRRTGGSK